MINLTFYISRLAMGLVCLLSSCSAEFNIKTIGSQARLKASESLPTSVNGQNADELVLSGSCVTRAGNVTLSGPVDVQTACVNGQWTQTVDLSEQDDGEVRIMVEQGDQDTEIVIIKDTERPSPPTTLTLSQPKVSPNTDTTPTISLSGLEVGGTVQLYSNASCSAVISDAVPITKTTMAVTTRVLSNGSYVFYSKQADAAGNSSECSTASVIYQVQDSVDVNDSAAPNPGNSGLIAVSDVTSSSLTLTWTAANDNVSSPGNLQYLVYYATSASFDSVSAVEAGTAVGAYSANLTTKSVTALSPSTTYYFNIIVRDESGNKEVYAKATQATAALSQVATPSFSPSAGVYPVAQNVTISSTTSGASLYYTTDGSTPTSASTLYSGAINVSSAMTIKAIAVKAGWLDSAVATAAYNIGNQVIAPTFSIPGDSYVGTQNVSIETATPSSTIYYTDDGSEPTASSTLYTGPITVTTTTTFKAIAVKGGLIDSEVTIAGYIITGTPLVDSASPSTVGTEALGNATWMNPNNVSLSDGSNATADMSIEELTPYLKATNYNFNIPAGSIISGITVEMTRFGQDVNIYDYRVQLVKNNTIMPISRSHGTIWNPSTSTTKAYGSETDLWGETWTPDDINNANFGVAIAAKNPFPDGFMGSLAVDHLQIKVHYFIDDDTRAKTPQFSPQAGPYSSSQSVTITSATPGATIYYTTNGEIPTTSSPQYTGPITVNSSTTLRAIAVLGGIPDSSMAVGGYYITEGSSCKDILDSGINRGNGLYGIAPDISGTPTPMIAYCDMTTDGGGWTLCFSDGHNRKGIDESDGFEFLSSLWKSDVNYVFSFNNSSVRAYGNFCPAVTHTEVLGKRFADPNTLTFTTATLDSSTGNLFVDAQTRLVNGSDELATSNRTAFAGGYYSGSTCSWVTNAYNQGSSLCISVGTNFQMFQGNINHTQNVGIGDHMCLYNATCNEDTTGAVVQILVR